MLKYTMLITSILMTNSFLFSQKDLSDYDEFNIRSYKNNTIINNTEKLINKDFSILWKNVDSKNIFGFIGKNYTRLNMKFMSVIKNPKNEYEYLIYGKSKVYNNICEFQGKIIIKSIFQFDTNNEQKIKEGTVVGIYQFNEDSNHKHSGIFKGKFVTHWTTDSIGNIIKVDLPCVGGNFEIDRYAGTWKKYNSQLKKKANWGLWRIPQSKELDVGTSEFCPSEKYTKYGWGNYMKAHPDGNSENIKAYIEENKKWWK